MNGQDYNFIEYDEDKEMHDCEIDMCRGFLGSQTHVVLKTYASFEQAERLILAFCEGGGENAKEADE